MRPDLARILTTASLCPQNSASEQMRTGVQEGAPRGRCLDPNDRRCAGGVSAEEA
jgi:hypothetical protein